MILVLQNAQFEMDNKFYATWNFYMSYTEGHVAAAGKWGHQLIKMARFPDPSQY